MPLTLTVKSRNEESLGDLPETLTQLADRLDGFTAYREPGIDEKLAALPEDMRDLYMKTVGYLPPSTKGDYTFGELTLEFTLVPRTICRSSRSMCAATANSCPYCVT